MESGIMTRETVGKISSDLIIKQPETTSPIEQMQECLTDYEKNIWECVERCRKDFEDNFYVVVTTKRERLMPNVYRNFYYGRRSCPTPEWDQTVYKYKYKDSQIIFMWVIPSKDACEYLSMNASYVVKEEQQLLKYVLAFNDGTLMSLAKDLNGEKEFNVELRDFTWKG
jgi:hypothetical protein